MKHNHFDMLPIRAFKPRSGSRFTAFGGGGMTLEGGGDDFISDIVDSVSDVVDSVGQAVSDVAQTISDVGVQIDKSVNDAVPGGWATVGAVVATVATMGAAAPLAEGALAADAAMAAETAGAIETGMEAATIGADAAVEAGTAEAVAAGESTSLATEVGTTVAETVPAADVAIPADFVGPTGIADVAAADAAAQQAAFQAAAEAAGTGAAKGAGLAALKDVIRTGEINPNDLLTGALTGGVGGGIGSLASDAAQTAASANDLGQYASQIGKTAGTLAGGVAGGATGAAATGRDPLTGAITGGIAGLTGAAGQGLGAGLQAAGLDATGAGIVGNTIMGAGKAALTGQDTLTAALNAGVGSTIGAGLSAAGNAAYNDIKSALPDLTPSSTSSESPAAGTQLADSGATASDFGMTPTQVAMQNAAGQTPTAPTVEDQSNLDALIKALYPDSSVSIEPAPASFDNAPAIEAIPAEVNADGVALDSSGNPIGYAANLGFVSGVDADGNPAWYDPKSGNVLPVIGYPNLSISSDTSPSNDFSAPSTSTIAMPASTAEQEALAKAEATNYPSQIINNPDGTITTIENDGSKRIFNLDGSVTMVNPDGSVQPVAGTELSANVYPDGKGGYTDINGYPVTQNGTPLTYNANGDLIAPDGSVYQAATPYTPSSEDKTTTYPLGSSSASSGSSGNLSLGNLASSLLGGVASSAVKGLTGKSGSGAGNLLTGLGAFGLGIAGASEQTTSPTPQFTYPGANLDWGVGSYTEPVNGVAYGQQYLNPTIKKAAEGGLMSIGGSPNTVTPTISSSNGLSDPNNAVQMFANGGSVDMDTMQIVKHLNSIGAPVHHIAGFLEHRKKKMAEGGHLGDYSDGGRMLKGPGDGMSDNIPATIAGKQPARLATDEFVVPADVVSHLGNGSSDAGAKVLYDMMDRIRKARTGTTKQGKQINPKKFMPK